MQTETFEQKSQTETKSSHIPIHGSMTRPASPEVGFDEMRDGRVAWTGGDLEVKIETAEFTSVCPTTGQPDFNRIEITYRPDKYYLESKTVKFYLWAFRDHGAHCETLAKIICNHVFDAIQAFSAEVRVIQSPRGGLGITSEFKRTREAK